MATFSFTGVPETVVRNAWGQCPQELAGTARKIVKGEGVGLEGRVLQLQLGGAVRDPVKDSWGQTHMWGLSILPFWPECVHIESRNTFYVRRYFST